MRSELDTSTNDQIFGQRESDRSVLARSDDAVSQNAEPARWRTAHRSIKTAALVVVPQVVAAFAFLLPQTWITELPADVDGNAKVAQGGGAFVLGILFAFLALPAVSAAMAPIFAERSKQSAAASTTCGLGLVGLVAPIICLVSFASHDPERTGTNRLMFWFITNLLIVVSVRNHHLFDRPHSELAHTGDYSCPTSCS